MRVRAAHEPTLLSEILKKGCFLPAFKMHRSDEVCFIYKTVFTSETNCGNENAMITPKCHFRVVQFGPLEVLRHRQVGTGVSRYAVAYSCWVVSIHVKSEALLTEKFPLTLSFRG